MFASVLRGQRDVRYEEIETPTPGPGQVLIDVRATGVCGSDVPRVLSDGAHFYPMVLGHEFAGVVADLGPGVDGAAVGDRVAVAPLVPCLRCAVCQQGTYSLCPDYTFIGSRVFGALAEYVAVPATNLVRLDDAVGFVQGALFEPSTVALHGVLVNDFHGGEDVAVLGGGTVGLFTAQWARILGARKVVVFDISDARLEVALRLGADEVVNTSDPGAMERLAQMSGRDGFGYVFETAGQNATMSLAFQIAGNRSRVCFIGNSHRDLTFDHALFEQLNRKELRLTGSWMSYSAPFPGPEWTQTARYFADGRLRYDPALLHGTFALDQVGEAFELFTVPGAVTGKLMFVQGS